MLFAVTSFPFAVTMPEESPVIVAPLSENVIQIVPSTVVIPLSSVLDLSFPLSSEPESEPESELESELEPEPEFEPEPLMMSISLPLQATIIRALAR